jgi:hypothetical protein
LFVVVDLAVGEPGVIIDSGVHVAVADLAVARRARRSAVDTPAATGWDLAELLDVDVHEVARMVVLVAAHDTAGRPVHPRQP